MNFTNKEAKQFNQQIREVLDMHKHLPTNGSKKYLLSIITNHCYTNFHN